MPPRKQVLVEKNSTSAHVNKKQPQRSEYHNKIIGIFKAAQTSNSFHLKYQKELKSIYELVSVVITFIGDELLHFLIALLHGPCITGKFSLI